MLKRKLLLTLVFAFAAFSFAGTAMAATSVSWLTPADGSTYTTGTVLGASQVDGAITGIAGADGTIGGAGLDLALVIDESGSMGGSGITYARQAAIALVNSLPADTTSVAVIGFDSYSHTYRQLTALNPDKQTVINAINSIGTGGGTNIGAGVSAGASALVNGHTTGRAMMQVVLSDGVGTYYNEAATAYNSDGIITHTVGIPGHNAAQMAQVATDGHGIYTNVSDLTQLEGLFNGTGGNLVGVDHVDIQLADGTWIYNISIDGLGNFTLPDQVIALGANTFTAYVTGTDGTTSSAILTLNGTDGGGAQAPEPTTMLLFGLGLLGFTGVTRRKK
nr:VWA domain-containing protein [uncultured Desulfobacter sp.]